MKKILLLSVTAGFAYLSLTSLSAGLGTSAFPENRTGSDGATNTDCSGSGCHDANTSNVMFNIRLRDMNGDTIKNNKYFPNAVYHVLIFGSVSGGSFPKWGFQLSARKEYGSPKGGDYIMTSGLHSTIIGQYEIVEQNAPLSTSGFNNTFSTAVLWKAPQSNSGAWTIYATVLAANNDQSRLGDKTNNDKEVFAPVPVSVGAIDNSVGMKVYPNPVKDQLQFRMDHAEAGDYTFTIYNTQGQIMEKANRHIPGADFQASFDASGWATGNYFLEVLKDGRRRIIPLVKQ